MNNKHEKNFDLWNSEKKILEQRVLPPDFFFLEREIWWTAIGVNIGKEIDGKNELFERPVLVVKKVNEELLYAIPITSTQKDQDGFYPITYKGRKFSLCILQIKSISSQRLLRLLTRINEEDFNKILLGISLYLGFIKNETPDTGGISMGITGE